MIELRNIGMTFGDNRVIEAANVQFEAGEFISILGPSGSGKSTLLNVIAGLLTPTDGNVIVNGNSLADLKPRERTRLRRETFGFVFQTFNLIPYLTVRENVEVPLCLRRVPSIHQKGIATELLRDVGLEDKVSQFPSRLSVGERQRVTIARALANRPKVLLADEPTGNLDSGNGTEMMSYFKKLHEDGVTILLVTHDREMTSYATRALTMKDGRLS